MAKFIEKINMYLNEGKEYKEGDIIKVTATRKPVYQPTGGHVPREKESKKSLEVVKKIDKTTYLVKIKGMWSKYSGGVKVPKSGRLHVKGKGGTLSTSPPKPAKWEIEID